MTNYLRYPEFLAITNLDIKSKDRFKESVDVLIKERHYDSGLDKDECLTATQIDQLNRLVDHMYNNTDEDSKLNINRKDFFNFTQEYDKRRGTSFDAAFPDLKQFYKLCQEA